MNDLSAAFASALFFRILLPGLVVSIGVHPLVMRLPQTAALDGLYPGGAGALFLAEVVTFGLIAYAASTPVYHIAQGLVLPWLTRPAQLVNEWRFERKYTAFTKSYGDQTYAEVGPETAEKLQQLFVYLSDYPIERDETGTARFTLHHSTRVGNITATYERYPDTRYGVNAEGYWEHFLFLVPAETRKELDSVQAIATGTLLSAAAGWVVVGICVMLAVARAFYHFTHVSVGPLPVPDVALLWLAAYGIAAVVLFNYLTRVVHREYGRLFRACFDVHVTDFERWLDQHQPIMTAERIRAAEAFRQYASALVLPDSMTHPSSARADRESMPSGNGFAGAQPLVDGNGGPHRAESGQSRTRGNH